MQAFVLFGHKVAARTHTYGHVFALALLGLSHPVGSQAAVSAGVLFGYGFKLLQQTHKGWKTLICWTPAAGSALTSLNNTGTPPKAARSLLIG